MSQALNGIRVIDMTHNQAGPACAQILGFLGADVIKLEEPKGGDVARTNMRDKPDSDSLFFLMLNANKRSLTLNLKTEEGKALFRQVIARSDVLLENFGPGALDRLGLGYDVLSQLNPQADLRHHQGLRHLRPLQRLQELRADRPGDGRRDERHRLPGEPADLHLPGDRRFRHRHAHGDRHPGRAAAAPRHRQGPARRGLDAGRRGQPDPRQPARPPAHRPADAAHRQPARPHRSRQPPIPAPRAGRTTTCISSPSRRCGCRSWACSASRNWPTTRASKPLRRALGKSRGDGRDRGRAGRAGAASTR